jgi:hypothetical protein
VRQTTIADFYPSFIDEVYSFNQQAGLLEAGYDDFLESSFQVEEALEGLDTELLVQTYDIPPYSLSPKDIARAIVGAAIPTTPVSDVERLDKHIDSIIFNIGSIAKLGLTPQQIATAISIVTSANLQKLSMPKDEFGKLTKPADFIGPEAQLQALLDARQIS